MNERPNEIIDTMLTLLQTWRQYAQQINKTTGSERRVLEQSMRAALDKIRALHAQLPPLLNALSVAQPLVAHNEENVVPRLSSERTARYLKTSSISKKALHSVETSKSTADVVGEFQASRGYIKFSTLVFGSLARKLTGNNWLAQLRPVLAKSNMGILYESYLSLIFMNALLSVVAGIVAFVFLTFFTLSIIPFDIAPYHGALGMRLLSFVWLPFVTGLAGFFGTYYYPSTEESSVASAIDRELPFAVIHMSAISSSGIEPAQLFRIIATGKEYPALRKEFRKVLNQINLYGYDLVSALSLGARSSSSQNLADLFSGLSATITSGGTLTSFFSKRAESLLLDYRLEREKFTKTAETFMDLYITIVIAAPMILLLIVIMLNLSSLASGLSPSMITGIIIGVITLLNVIFISLLQLKQPVY